MPAPDPDSPAFGVFERDALPERIASRLISLIAERQLHPGDKLPPERELAGMMQVSRPSLREALRALAMQNIVEIRQGSGTYVTSLRPELLVEHLDFVFFVDDSTFAELLEARLVVEPSIAGVAARRASDEELALMCATMERAAEHVDDPEAFLSADLALHEMITSAGHNQIISRFMLSLMRLGTASRRRTVALPGVRAQTLAYHRAIVEALLRRDSEAAATAMRQHLEALKTSLLGDAALDSNGTNASGGQDVADHDVG